MLSFKLFAGTNVGLRENNEDNFTVCPDLTKGKWIIPTDSTNEMNLGKRGCLMVVADGMGGQNAGEVASDIAVKTVEEMFSPQTLPADILDKPEKIATYLKKVVETADSRVKRHGKEHAEADGLGSTIVMVWLLGDKVYIAWLGDSRAYSYRPGEGIGRLSKDHSYVQQLVDKGILTDEEAMHHPQSNIITRSLGDTSKHAKAEVVEHDDLKDGEIIMLCSDGLCGVCSDDQIGSLLMEAEHGKSLQECKDMLTNMALNAGGSDNITIALIQICKNKETDVADSQYQEKTEKKKKRHGGLIMSVVSMLALLILIGCFVFCGVNSCPKKKPTPIKSTTKVSDKTQQSATAEFTKNNNDTPHKANTETLDHSGTVNEKTGNDGTTYNTNNDGTIQKTTLSDSDGQSSINNTKDTTKKKVKDL